MRIVTSCNIACGGHTGSLQTMRATLLAAMRNHVVVGAHPSYPDPEGFGRRSRFSTGDALYGALVGQLAALAEVAAEVGATLHHVKPHGALYNDAGTDSAVAEVVVRAARTLPVAPTLVGLPNSELERAAKAQRLSFAGEAFIDRAYAPDGTLVSRSRPGAVFSSPAEAVEQALSIVLDQRVILPDGSTVAVRADTLCIHGDTQGAAETAGAVRRALEEHGVTIRATAT